MAIHEMLANFLTFVGSYMAPMLIAGWQKGQLHVGNAKWGYCTLHCLSNSLGTSRQAKPLQKEGGGGTEIKHWPIHSDFRPAKKILGITE